MISSAGMASRVGVCLRMEEAADAFLGAATDLTALVLLGVPRGVDGEVMSFSSISSESRLSVTGLVITFLDRPTGFEALATPVVDVEVSSMSSSSESGGGTAITDSFLDWARLGGMVEMCLEWIVSLLNPFHSSKTTLNLCQQMSKGASPLSGKWENFCFLFPREIHNFVKCEEHDITF